MKFYFIYSFLIYYFQGGCGKNFNFMLFVGQFVDIEQGH